MKKILGVYNAPRGHWVGDGFPVRSLFAHQEYGKILSPFLLLDYAGPAEFTPSDTPRGVGQHPHRGFETVTIVYQGEVAHKDSTGKGGVIGPGDVQWMSASSGILHEEFHSEAFTKTGGVLEMMQLWVNLPAKDKMTEPGYQSISSNQIPTVLLSDKTSTMRVIAGEYEGTKGPAHTFTQMNVLDLKLVKDSTHKFSLPENWHSVLVVLHGTILVNKKEIARDAQMIILEPEGTDIVIEANSDATLLLLSGEPIDEPIVGYGPFVMNTEDEIHQAINDFNRGRFGQLPAV